MADQFQPGATRSGLVVIPAPGVLARDFHGHAALGAKAHLLSVGQFAVRVAQQRDGKIRDPVVQQFRQPGHRHAGACTRLSGGWHVVEIKGLALHCHWRGTFTLQSRIGMSARTACTRWVQAISCSGRVSMIRPL